ncbi:glycoside hydrolase family 19 protein [Bosea sp. NPDC055594]
MSATELLVTIFLSGMMGLVGQGARAVIGLKKLNDANAGKDPGQADLFLASRLLISLMIGFIAGVLAAFALGLGKLIGTGNITPEILLGIAAAGYVGSDFIEGFIAKTPAITAGAGPGGSAFNSGAGSASGSASGGPAAGSATQSILASQINAEAAGLRAEVASIRSLLAGNMTEAGWSLLSGASGATPLTPELVARLFVPETPLGNIRRHLPHVRAGLRAYGLIDRDMLLMALATIRAETEGFVPIDEFQSQYNTEKVPFDLYEPDTPIGKKLGNTEVGDGARFKGRGFVQLTGRWNYTELGKQINVDLVAHPELANDPKIAGQLLACFLANKEDAIRTALAAGDLKTARKLVNGGSHGFDRFKDAYDKGIKFIPDGVEV